MINVAHFDVLLHKLWQAATNNFYGLEATTVLLNVEEFNCQYT